MKVRSDAVKVFVGGRNDDGAGVAAFVRFLAVDQGQGRGLQLLGFVPALLGGDQTNRVLASGQHDVALRAYKKQKTILANNESNNKLCSKVAFAL